MYGSDIKQELAEAHQKGLADGAEIRDRLEEQNRKLKEFARSVLWVDSWSWTEAFRSDIRYAQRVALRLGVIEKGKATAEDCKKDDLFDIGVKKFRFTKWMGGG